MEYNRYNNMQKQWEFSLFMRDFKWVRFSGYIMASKDFVSLMSDDWVVNSSTELNHSK